MGDRSRRAAVLLVFGLAACAVAATSPATYRTWTTVDKDAVIVAAGGPAVVRTSEIQVQSFPQASPAPGDSGPSVRVQARPRWPLNDPPARFVLTVDDVGTATGEAPVVSIPVASCSADCRFAVQVAIDWLAGPDRGESSVAWELAVTQDAGSSGYLAYGAPSIRIVRSSAPGAPTVATGQGSPPWLLVVLLFLPLSAVFVARQRAPAPVLAGTGDVEDTHVPVRNRRLDVALVGAVLGLIAILAFFVFVVLQQRSIAGLFGGPPFMVGLVAGGAAAALVWGAIAWLQGDGLILTTTLGVMAVVGVPIAVVLVANASPTFADRGLLLGVAFVALLTIGSTVAPLRLGGSARLATPARIAILISQVALICGLALATPGFAGGAVLLLAFLHALAVSAWWGGRRRWLWSSALLIAAGTGLAMLMGGPAFLGGSRWTDTENVLHFGILLGCFIALLAAMGTGEHPDRVAAAAAAAERRARELIAESAASGVQVAGSVPEDASPPPTTEPRPPGTTDGR